MAQILNERTSGILLHPTSLPGPHGSGDLGFDAYKYIDWLASAGQTYWQILPIGEIGPGNSPYMSSSAFAGNILLIDPDELAKCGWLSAKDIGSHTDFPANRVNFSQVHSYRMELLRRASSAFFARRNNFNEYEEFCHVESSWLDDYALFMTLQYHHHGLAWSEWPAELVTRDPVALKKVQQQYSEKIGFWKFCQWSFSRQWAKLKKYANKKNVRIIGDVPIFVAYQSADVWSHQDLFELDENGYSTAVAGVPPDYFSQTGQLWGNPLYKWDAHQRDGYAWWISRLKHALKLFELVRIDHFRGFAGYWEIPAGESTAINGKWKPGPGANLFNAFKEALGDLPIIAEDLGMITPDVIELRDRFNLPGMRVLQFAFSEGENHPFLPHHYIPNSVAYTGTHDNDTSIGWWHSASAGEKSFAQQYLDSDGHEIQWDLITAISQSEANTVIIPMQDALGLNGKNRMNFPGISTGNWEWRFTWDQVYPEITQKLLNISVQSGRYN